MALHTRQSNRFNTTLSSWDMAIHKHLPLEGDREIRLMDIYPGVFADTLRVHVYQSTLSETSPPQYDALSYVWGSPDVPVKIDVQVTSTEGIVSDHEVLIIKNLATALKHLRFPDVSRTVWADAICINQNDYVERSKQVLIMGDIYRFGQKVVAFLGPEKDDSSYGLQILQQLSDAVEVDFSSGHVKPSPAVASEPLWADMQQGLPFHHRELPAIYHLIQREWFERLWVRQEIGLGGRNAVLLCGNKELPWLSFCRAIFVIWRKPVNADVFDATEYRIFRDRLRNADAVALYSMRAFRFTNLRRQIGESKCSDQRDRIYAVLGQLRDTDQIGIIPDYAKTVTEVYVDATRKHIKHFGNLSILCQCELNRSNPEPALQLPSWAPDWSRTMRSSAVHGIIPPLFDLLPFIAPIDDQLQAYGARCGVVRRVARIGDEILHSGSDAEISWKIGRILSEIFNDSSVQDTYGSRDSILEAYCRTLWLNNFDNRWNPPVPHEAPYQDCLSLIRALVESDISEKEISAIPNLTRCLDCIREACRGRAVITTEEGGIGLVPDTVTVGDEVCVLFSCYKPMLLRSIPNLSSSGSLQHRVVGECYLHDMMQGEAILGRLPEHLRGLLDSNGLMGLRSAGFIDTRTKEIHEEDPRMEMFLGKLVEKGFLLKPTLEELQQKGALDVLTNAGIPVRLFHIV